MTATLNLTNLQNESSLTPNIVLNADGSTTLSGAVNVGGGNISPQTGFKNRIINGGMVVDQRNAGAAVTPVNGQFITDRFRVALSQASKFTAQQSTVAPTGFINSLLITSSSAYAIGAGDFFDLRQPVEGFNVADLGWGTANAQSVTLSFWVRSSLTGTFGGALKNSAADRSYPFSYTISAANSWEYKTIIIPGDTTGTWLTNNSTGIFLQFGFGVGSTFSGTAGAWAAGNLISATGATSVVGTNGATFYITGVQLEKGSTATPFEFRSIGQELALCQRYYETVSVAAAGAAHTNMGVTGRYAVVKRAAPTLARTGSWNSGGEVGTLVGINETGQFFVYNPTTSTFNVGGTFTSSAEL